MATVIAFANHKGGVGKTTTCQNISYSMGNLEKNVLMLDLDPQASLTIAEGFEPDSLGDTMYNVICEDIRIPDVVLRRSAHLELAPSVIDLAAAETRLAGKYGRENILKKKLSSIKKNYDYIFIDCPPSYGLLTVNALAAADYIIVPVCADYLSFRGMELIFTTIDQVRDALDVKVKAMGIVVNMFDGRTGHAREISERIGREYPGHLFEHYIKQTVRMKDATASGRVFIEKFPRDEVTEQYRKITEEIIRRSQ